jgi:hypothetical protein
MRFRLVTILVLLVLCVCCGSGSSLRNETPSGSGPTAPSPAPTPSPSAPPAPQPLKWDLEAQGIPRFITHNYIELANITRISRFRSGEGHDYSDDVEKCRSMKHYFVPRFATMDTSTIPVYSPISGDVFRLRQEWAGVQIEIQSADYPAFRPILFHVNATIPLSEGTKLAAGQRLGTHIGNQTSSDVAIAVDSTRGLRFVSWFDAITDELMASYTARGIESRDAAIISQSARDASPLTCNGEAFVNGGTINNWLLLR